ncbi:amidohydrolase [Halopseudomonas laoshanensis]|uniref:Amidohydrolase n=2 Tax=Halopseudomonas laoshanensis TaxID=2268758 RepID=A0A7V7GXP5_9GAMM|nr:amidohydrolase [Halopseudomonas laoshanensis]
MPSIHLALGLLLSLLVMNAQARDYAFSDAHFHYVDFFQESEGIKALLEKMDESNIDHIMFSGIPVAKKWHENEPQRPRYYAGDDAAAYWYSATDFIILRALEHLTPDQRKRFHPFLSGFNPNDKNADAHIRRLLEMNPGVWKGLGEVFTRHDDLTALISGDVPRANNEAMYRIYALAEEFDLPVMVHSNITSKRERMPLYLEEIEDPLRYFPNVRFIWAHAGTSMELHRHQEKLEFLFDTVKRMLETYPNLYIDLSWTVLDPYLLNKDGEANAQWVKLVTDYPDRFMLGSDVVGSFKNMDKYLDAFIPFLDALPEEVAHKVARDNFLAVLPSEKEQD